MPRPKGSKNRNPNERGELVCSVCREWKSPEAFYSHKGTSTGRDYRCKACTKIMNNSRPADVKRKDNSAQRDKRDALLRTLKDHPCMRCGGRFHHAAMDWHHRDPSTKSKPYSMRYLARAKLLEEIKNCDLLCANCHHITHYELKRGGDAEMKNRIIAVQ